MDRALKERIIGAVVLVAIIVLVVPVFLDGPAPDPEMISEPVVLPGQTRAPGARKTVVLERDRDQPLPDAAPREGTGRATLPEARDQEPAASTVADSAVEESTPEPAGAAAGERPAAAAAPEPEPEAATARREADEAPPSTSPESDAAVSVTGMWAVQLGSFSNKSNADRLAASLREQGYAAFLSQHRTAAGELHRVRIGPQEDRRSAEAVAARLNGEGLKGQVVPHP